MNKDLLTITRLEEPCGLRLVGELDMSTAPALSEALGELGCPNGDIHLDLSELTFMDSTGVHILFDHARRNGSARSLVLVNPVETVRRTLELLMVENHPRVHVRSVRNVG